MNKSLHKELSTMINLASSYRFPLPLSWGKVMDYPLVEGLVARNR